MSDRYPWGLPGNVGLPPGPLPEPPYGFAQPMQHGNRIPPEYFGVPTNVLWHWFGECQRCLQELSVQQKVESISYSQADGGSRAVTYTRADYGILERRLRDLGRVLGVNQRRRAITPIF
jgi:gpW